VSCWHGRPSKASAPSRREGAYHGRPGWVLQAHRTVGRDENSPSAVAAPVFQSGPPVLAGPPGGRGVRLLPAAHGALHAHEGDEISTPVIALRVRCGVWGSTFKTQRCSVPMPTCHDAWLTIIMASWCCFGEKCVFGHCSDYCTLTDDQIVMLTIRKVSFGLDSQISGRSGTPSRRL
jgi:hypothetical protein